MCVPAEWLSFLRAHGYDCGSWLALGAPDAPDSAIMGRALADGRIVLTNDLDFGRLLAFSRATHPSVIQFRAFDIRPETIGPAMLQALVTHREALARGALVTIEPSRTRARILPLSD
ncbi:MAG TPA: DUF5615 family PIN-like protein [Opitutus sp.]|nr:DUF5615 family PIN-like protein [Opitutus sp.]